MNKGTVMNRTDFKTEYNEYLTQVQSYLETAVPAQTVYPEKIHEAMRYSLFAGGKRLRPVLCAAVYNMFHEDIAPVLPVACSLECIHTYSLIHDDLPCMDDDDFRRGMPTCHKKYGEAIAVLAGDALLTEAFALVASYKGTELCSMLVRELADACGSRGLIGGQVMDMLSENKQIDIETLQYIHAHKTGKLIVASVRLGAICAGVDESALSLLTQYAESIGLAFQISDDILDVTGSTEELGKQVGQDQKLHKATYPAIFGLDTSKEKLDSAIAEACSSLECFGDAGEFLKQLAQFVGYRKN